MKNNNLNLFDKIWFWVFMSLIFISTIYYSITSPSNNWILDWIISPIGAISGVICVILCAKGKISTYVWGVINCITYGYVSYKGGIYGDTIINIFFFLPFQFIGYVVWKRKLNNEQIVTSTFLKYPITTMILSIISIGIFVKLLTSIDSWLTNTFQKSSSLYTYIEKIIPINGIGAIFDASTEVGQFIGQILMAWAKVEQWYAWIFVNIVSIFMWILIIVSDKSTISWAMPALLMWVAFLGNAFYGLYSWKKRSQKI